MAKIVTVIGSRAFELIRNRIAEILTDEIENQGLLTYDIDLLDADVFIENDSAEDMTNLACVNVSLLRGSWGERKDYSGKNKGKYLYAIDVYTNANTTSVADGDYRSAVALHKLVGVCYGILDNPIYRTLGYTPGFVERVKNNEFNFRAKSKHDAKNTRMARMIFEVEAEESLALLEPTILAEFKTNLQLELTDKGYLYTRQF